jgi:uncharacterized protein (DUF1697 family)
MAHRFIVLLRGINVGGKNKLKMEDLRAALADVGFGDPQTYIQSGNIRLESPYPDSEGTEKGVSDCIKNAFGLDIASIALTHVALLEIQKANPYHLQPGIDIKNVYFTFLSRPPIREAWDKICPADYEPEVFTVSHGAIHLYFPNGYGKAQLTNTFFEKKLKVLATTRNWNTVQALLDDA